MKAVYVKEPKSLDIAELPMPQAGKGELLVRVRAAGICGSDMHIYHGTNPLAEYPRVIGHEFAGEVVAVGEDLPREKRWFMEGDHVAVDPVTSCGACYACSVGRPNVCSRLKVFGVHRDGGMAEYVAVPAANAHLVSESWPWEMIAMVEPFSIAANVLTRVECRPLDQVLVMGAGPIGLSILMLAVFLGARVAVADVLDSRLETARELGAELAVNNERQNLKDEMFKWAKEGVPVIVDAVCIPEIFPSLLEIASPAGRIAHLGFSERPAKIVPLEITKKELTIFGSRLNRRKFPAVIECFQEGLDPLKLVSHKFPFTQARDAFDLLETKPLETCKVLLTF
jgi:L-gulonate 5-dehydrogenase